MRLKNLKKKVMPLGEMGIMAIATGAGNAIDAFGRSKDVKREIQARKEEAELAYQRSVEMWHMQNAYNSPEEQMKRFGAAGLNPHLIYGQGSAGNANQAPQYQPPQIQTQGVTPPYGAAVGSAIQDLMAVGTWMQNMKMSEVEIERRKTDTEKMEQMVQFLQEKFPHEIRKFGQVESLWPYQKDAQESGMYKGRANVAALLEEFRHRYGVELDVGAPYKSGTSSAPGMRELERMVKGMQARKTGLEADWLDPEAVYTKMIMGGVLGMLFRQKFKPPTKPAPKKVGSRTQTRISKTKSGGSVRNTVNKNVYE